MSVATENGTHLAEQVYLLPPVVETPTVEKPEQVSPQLEKTSLLINPMVGIQNNAEGALIARVEFVLPSEWSKNSSQEVTAFATQQKGKETKIVSLTQTQLVTELSNPQSPLVVVEIPLYQTLSAGAIEATLIVKDSLSGEKRMASAVVEVNADVLNRLMAMRKLLARRVSV